MHCSKAFAVHYARRQISVEDFNWMRNDKLISFAKVNLCLFTNLLACIFATILGTVSLLCIGYACYFCHLAA